MSSGLVLHVRLTKHCNADCSYCSSWQSKPDDRLSPEDLLSCFHYLFTNVYPRLNVFTSSVTVQYVGGEILTYPKNDLSRAVISVRNFLEGNNIHYMDGVQSNLIGSAGRLNHLIGLFGRRIGTSVETFASDRTINGSSARYKSTFKNSISHLNTQGVNPGAVFTMDENNYTDALKEYEQAEKDHRNLTLRYVFEGGREVNQLPTDLLTEAYLVVFEKWFIKSKIIIEPFMGMLKNRIGTLTNNYSGCRGCHFQSDCASRSINIEPNGDLFVCYDMADADRFCLGNGIHKTFDYDLWNMINGRQINLPVDCKSCEYLSDCQGGCMVEALEAERGLYGKTPYCNTWKALFHKMDEKIKATQLDKLTNWLNTLETNLVVAEYA